MLGRMLGIMLHWKRKRFLERRFSSIKSLHRKYRFVHFFGSASETGFKKAVTYLENQPSNTQDLTHTFSLTWKLASFFLRYACFVRRFPQNKVYPAEFAPSLHVCPILPNGSTKGKMLGRMLGIMLHRKRKRFLERRFSSLKSLHRKYRFVRVFGSARGGGVQEGSNLLGKPTVKYLGPSSRFFTNIEVHFTFVF